MIRRILLLLSVAALMAAVVVASAMPALAQGKGPEGGNPGKGLFLQAGRTVGEKELQPLPFGGQDPDVLPGSTKENKGSEQGLFHAGPAVVCKAPGSPFFAPEICPLF